MSTVFSVLVGLAQRRQLTLFNTLTKAGIAAENYPADQDINMSRPS
jgi:ribosome-binding ATPase YchF (GTP1/OBG family)